MNRQIQYDYKGGLSLHQTEEETSSLILPENIGLGYYNHTSTQAIPGVSICKFKPTNSLILDEHMASTNLCTMSFCLGDTMEFSIAEANNKEYYIEHNECCIMTEGTQHCTSIFEKEQQYYGISISFEAMRLQNIAETLQYKNAINNHKSIIDEFKRYTVTPRVTGILMEVVNCNICGCLREVYLEAKLMELIAVSLNEMFYCQKEGLSDISLSKEDMSALLSARKILDKTFVHPLTISQLSKKVYLNEYKLKKGFKQCFGQTVYGYIMDKRMELAQILIEQQRYKISDIAGMVGYANTSHFITAFSKKYGVTPGAFL